MQRAAHWSWLAILVIIAARPWVLDLVLPERLLLVQWTGIAAALAWWLLRRGWRHCPAAALLAPCAFLFVGYQQSVLLSAEPVEALLQGSALVLGILLLFAVSAANSARRKQLLVIIAGTGTALALKGLWQATVIFPALADFPWRQISSQPHVIEFAEQVIARGRVFGPFPLPGLMAAALILTLPVTVYLIRPWAATKKQRIIAMLAVAAQSASFILTQSLGGFLSLGLAVLIVLTLRRASIKQRLTILTVTVIAVGGLLAIRPELSNLTHARNPLVQRWRYWQSTVEMIRENPLRGVGAGSYAAAYAAHQRPNATQTRFAHSVWLQVWAEWGLLGLIGLVGLAVSVLRRLKDQPPELAIALWAYGMLASIDISWSVFQATCLWWPLLGLLTPAPAGSDPKKGV